MGGGSLNLEILRGGGVGSSSFGNSGGSGGPKTVPSLWGVDFFWNNPISKISSSYGIKQFCTFLF